LIEKETIIEGKPPVIKRSNQRTNQKIA